jgi:biotin carboxylase
LVAAPQAAVRHFDDKAAAYLDAGDRMLPVPPHVLVQDSESLFAGYEALSQISEQLCLKPVVGVGGNGFRVLTRQALDIAELLGRPTGIEHLDRVAEALDIARDRGLIVPRLMLMPFLTGPEVSVDVLADDDGEVLATVSRAKSSRRRSIVNDLAAQQVASTLVRAHRLSYLSNTQVRYWQGPSDAGPRPYLLEVNTRISGGLFQTSLVGWPPTSVRQRLNPGSTRTCTTPSWIRTSSLVGDPSGRTQ